MKNKELTKKIHPLTERESYSITLKQEENIDPFEIAECFKKQYPKDFAVISFARIIKMELGMLFVGLKLGGKKRTITGSQ